MYVCEWNMNNRRICTSRNREAKPFKGINEAQTHDDFHPDSLNNEQSLWIRPQLAQRKTTQMLKRMQAAWPPFVSRAEEPKFFSSYKIRGLHDGTSSSCNHGDKISVHDAPRGANPTECVERQAACSTLLPFCEDLFSLVANFKVLSVFLLVSYSLLHKVLLTRWKLLWEKIEGRPTFNLVMVTH